ncbi:BrnA antitoxin family protein [Mesorhizobium sp. B2-4-12]|uniref:BrnA antitoxin family protein n=1 Tax=unclassified Mesorhizobium TaxID=325217 RepID=UPI00112CBAE9|nr:MULTISPECIES: BrnA antitoxin family protein [unclassified Mesorhizobium]TPK87388.1 BrnA antitoxin family protein [Mesorhizobium sp. B2-4-17]TPK93137.1 BrnA antitoxin family protein [Mesorhizobium sp. B2-4-12]TPL02913.1 BrnA antitoxin family protein [Mesorhizobium sp. B2-4-14]UCI32888.1 BrnA antitoxin family protein [Mesorhizobium sp. B4-1-4]
MRKIVRFEFDPTNPSPLTEAQKAEIAALKARSQDDVDTSDTPELAEEFWQNAARNPHFRPIKQQLTLRLDSDLVAWFKRRTPDGRGYQSAINKALRDYMMRQDRKTG